MERLWRVGRDALARIQITGISIWATVFLISTASGLNVRAAAIATACVLTASVPLAAITLLR
jgi:hypothetical protein